MEVGWEVVENTPVIIDRFRQSAPAQGYNGDSVDNSVSDTLFRALGFWIAWRLPVTWSFAFVVVSEIALALLIHDNVEDIGPVSPYSLLLAEYIPDLTDQTVVDVGIGSGFLSIVARLQGAKRVYLLDTYESAIALALENAERNGVRDGLIHLPIGSSMVPLPDGERVNVIISNPAQQPLPQMESENSAFYAGPEGRSMIDAIITEAPRKLASSGRLLMTHVIQVPIVRAK